MPLMVINSGHGIVLPSTGRGGRPPCGQAFAAPMVCSDCPGSSGGKRVEFLYVEELYTQPVRYVESSDGKALVQFTKNLGLILSLHA